MPLCEHALSTDISVRIFFGLGKMWRLKNSSSKRGSNKDDFICCAAGGPEQLSASFAGWTDSYQGQRAEQLGWCYLQCHIARGELGIVVLLPACLTCFSRESSVFSDACSWQHVLASGWPFQGQLQKMQTFPSVRSLADVRSREGLCCNLVTCQGCSSGK